MAAYLRNFVDGSGGEWDWDDFISVPIADPELEDIRKRAMAVDLPPTNEGVAKSLRADVVLEYRPEGLIFQLTLPTAALEADR